jgi:hypothetical protein
MREAGDVSSDERKSGYPDRKVNEPPTPTAGPEGTEPPPPAAPAPAKDD